MVPVESSDPSDASDSGDAADPSGTVSTTDPSDASESSNASEDPSDADAYDPCGDKSCGETCQVCPPDDNDCVETGVVKACDAAGECVRIPVTFVRKPIMSVCREELWRDLHDL